MTTRLLGLDCSPREGSNSGLLLEESFKRLDAAYPGAVEHEVVHLRDLHVEPCKARKGSRVGYAVEPRPLSRQR